MTAAQRDELLLKIDKRTDRADLLIEGDGGKGILTRLDDIEKWIKQERWQLGMSWVIAFIAMGTLLSKLAGMW